MKLFGRNLIPFVLVAFAVYLLGNYQRDHHAPEGDLIKTSFLLTSRKYLDPPSGIPSSNTSVDSPILLVGDSHLDQRPTNCRYQEYLTTPVSSHSHWAYTPHVDVFSLGVSLTDSLKHELVIFEVVERNFFHFAQNFLATDSTVQIAPKSNNSQNHFSFVDGIGDGLRTLCSAFGLQHEWIKNDECQIRECHESIPLFSRDRLLITKKDEMHRKKPEEITAILNELKLKLRHHFQPMNIEFLVYIIPDKTTLYSPFCTCEDLHPSFLLSPPFSSNVSSPIIPMQTAIENGTMEVYKYSDTHLSPTGASIVGQHLDSEILAWLMSQEH